MSQYKDFDMTSLPDDLSKKILNDLMSSRNLSASTLKTLSKANKSLNKDINKKLYIFNHKTITKFCKFQNIDNVLPIIDQSIFSYEVLIDILEYIEKQTMKNKAQFKNLFPVSVRSVSYSCLNNTFVVFQIIKHSLILHNKCSDGLDVILFDFFEDVYTLKRSQIKGSPTKESSVAKFGPSQIVMWHLIGFNLYYVYDIYRMYQDNCKISMCCYKQFDKYLFSYDKDVLKRSIKFTAEEYHSLLTMKEYHPSYDYDVFINILSYIAFRLSRNVTNGSEIITLRHEDDHNEEIHKERVTIDTILKRMKISLFDLRYDNTIAKKILDLMQ
jgi:hypothetical protein